MVTKAQNTFLIVKPLSNLLEQCVSNCGTRKETPAL